nr:hypothetical protein [Tanacetum cinerariifolium]
MKQTGQSCSGIRNCQAQAESQEVREEEENQAFRVKEEDASKRGGIAELDADEDVSLLDVDAEVEMDTNIQGRMAESQAKAYNLDLQHFEKVLSMQDTDEVEPDEVEEVLEVVTAAKLMIEVVTTVAPITTAAQVPKPSALRRRRGVVIQDPEETAVASVIVHSKNDVMEQVKRREKQDNAVMRYQALKRKPLTKAQARKNMMIYLKNMVGFKMDFFKGIDNDIYSTVNACPNACEMWKAIERFYKMMNELIRNQCDVTNHQVNVQFLLQAATLNKGKAIVNSPQPIYDQEPSMVDVDDETSKDKEIDKLIALISLLFKKIYKPTNNNL